MSLRKGGEVVEVGEVGEEMRVTRDEMNVLW